jgi:hypothetical protein
MDFHAVEESLYDHDAAGIGFLDGPMQIKKEE